jgi:hypothetical protein
MEGTMTDTRGEELPSFLLPGGRFAESDFRAGQVLNRTFTVLSRNLLPFCLVSLVASLPNILVYAPTGIAPDRFDVWSGVGVVRAMLFALSQAAVLHAAVDDMRGRPINLIESLKLGLRRSFPVLGVAICVLILAALGAVALFFPALMVITMVFVAVPACVVERLGPIKSMERSARLTKGHRWKVFGLWIATLIVGLIRAEWITCRRRRRRGQGGRVAGLERRVKRLQRDPGCGHLS